MLTGAKPGFGNQISHSHRRTSRRFDPNIQRKRYWLPSEGRHVRLHAEHQGIKTVDTIGIEAAVAQDPRPRGEGLMAKKSKIVRRMSSAGRSSRGTRRGGPS